MISLEGLQQAGERSRPRQVAACRPKCTVSRHTVHFAALMLSPTVKRWGMLWCILSFTRRPNSATPARTHIHMHAQSDTDTHKHMHTGTQTDTQRDTQTCLALVPLQGKEIEYYSRNIYLYKSGVCLICMHYEIAHFMCHDLNMINVLQALDTPRWFWFSV